MDSSLYHQHVNGTTHHHRVRPVVVGAPYVLCGFAVGVILMAVGTFITSHAYDDKDRDPVLLGVGPGLLALGGLLLLSAVLICVVACLRNRKLREAFSDDFFTIGASTFYGGEHFVHMNDENHVGDGNESSEAVMILANTVAEERHRQNSRKYYRNQSYESGTQACYMGPQGILRDSLGREDPDYLGLDPIRRAELHPELAQDFGFNDSDDSRYCTRERSYSMSARRPTVHNAPVEERLRRNFSYTQASRARLQKQQLQRQRQQAGPLKQVRETQQLGPQRKRSSRRRKPQATINEVTEGPTIHQLPKYDPDLLRALGIGSAHPPLNRGLSEDGHLASGAVQPATWWENPDVTHGSLGSPRRRPSVVMGVKGIRPKQSGAAYRHSSSIYASDMDLHRTDATVTSDASQTGNEFRDFQSQSGINQYPSQTGSSMANRSLGSSPTLLPPYDNGDSSPQLDTRRENTPSSTPSHRRMRRPLSNISSASESCCSACCESNQNGAAGEPSEQEHQPGSISQEEADQSTDQRPQDSSA